MKLTAGCNYKVKSCNWYSAHAIKNAIEVFGEGLDWFSSSFCSRLGVNFINVLRAAFAHEDPKRANKLSVFFVLLESEHVKAAIEYWWNWPLKTD